MSLVRPRLFGRSGSHYTRLVRIVAYEAAVELPFQPIPDIRSHDPDVYGGHPGLKMPTLHDGGERVFGSLEICRRVVAASPTGLAVAWPEAFPAELRNAWELLSQAMLNQVQLAFGISVCGLPADHPFFEKARQGLAGILVWLEDRLPELTALEPAGDLSLFQATLFCLIEHMRFRPTFEPPSLPRLEALAAEFGARSSARASPYALDPKPLETA
jgi:glutathione S-transferase